jgi:hypothetical protein
MSYKTKTRHMLLEVDINNELGKSSTPEAETIDTKENTGKPIIICGLCGAKEQYISHNKTECPNCDEYIY